MLLYEKCACNFDGFFSFVRVQEKAPGITEERYLASACGFIMTRRIASRTKI